MKATKFDFSDIAAKHGITVTEANRIWNHVFKFIHDKISKLEFFGKDKMDVDSITTDFVLPMFGALKVNKNRINMNVEKLENCTWIDIDEKLKNKAQTAQQHEENQNQEN